ncbi:MAG TPA: hypothetical protein VKQ34_00565 [Candidatus Saccharimonadales bacterium]|nr:hypothetical protein [Candidatus Saccharimonadales bacterium]
MNELRRATVRSVDGVWRAQRATRAVQHQYAPTSAAAPQTPRQGAGIPPAVPLRPAVAPQRKPEVQPRKPSQNKSSRLRKVVVIMLKVLLWTTISCVVAWLAVGSLIAGEVIIGLYTVLVLWRRKPSRLTFGITMISLAGVIAANSLLPDSELPNRLGVYTFLLLIAGGIQLARELHKKRTYSVKNLG